MTTSSIPPVTVLVVDDQAPFRSAVRAVVSGADGFRLVAEAASAEEAVSAAASLRPDLVLMDIVMPGLDGVQATPRVLEASPSSVVVLVSTYEEADLPAGAATCGRRAYLHKADLTTTALRRLWDGRAAYC